MPDMKDFMDIVNAPMEGGDEAADHSAESIEMFKSLLLNMTNCLTKLAMSSKEMDGPVEPWVQDKLSRASEDLETVCRYICYEKEAGGEMFDGDSLNGDVMDGEVEEDIGAWFKGKPAAPLNKVPQNRMNQVTTGKKEKGAAQAWGGEGYFGYREPGQKK